MENKVDILTMLALHEQTLSYLYGTFVKKFDHEIWRFLTSEELKHSDWILSITDNVIDESVNFEPRSFTEEIISNSIKDLEAKIEECEQGNLSELQAFEYAMEIENGMLEKKFLDSFWSDYSGIQTVLDNLKAETKLHREMLEIEFGKFKNKQLATELKMRKVFQKTSTMGLHAEYERLLARLYTVFSRKFPDENLWEYLVEEEKKHEAWIKQIILKMIDETIIYDNSDESEEEIISSLVELKETINTVSNNEITAEEALELAYGIENSLLEKEFFNKFSSDAPAINKILSQLKADTIKHRDMLDSKAFS
jgi:hypothetical protein